MISDSRYARVLSRRETHRSRSTGVGIVLALLIVGLAYVGTECTLAALDLRALLVSPADALRGWRSGSPIVLGIAAGLAVLGIIVLLLALLPSRLPRHRIADQRSVLLVDDDVLASAVSQSVARTSGIGTGQARTAIGRSSAMVSVTPTSGRLLSQDAIRDHAAELIDGLELAPRIRTRAQLNPNGVIGA